MNSRIALSPRVDRFDQTGWTSFVHSSFIFLLLVVDLFTLFGRLIFAWGHLLWLAIFFVSHFSILDVINIIIRFLEQEDLGVIEPFNFPISGAHRGGKGVKFTSEHHEF